MARGGGWRCSGRTRLDDRRDGGTEADPGPAPAPGRPGARPDTAASRPHRREACPRGHGMTASELTVTGRPSNSQPVLTWQYHVSRTREPEAASPSGYATVGIDGSAWQFVR